MKKITLYSLHIATCQFLLYPLTSRHHWNTLCNHVAWRNFWGVPFRPYTVTETNFLFNHGLRYGMSCSMYPPLNTSVCEHTQHRHIIITLFTYRQTNKQTNWQLCTIYSICSLYSIFRKSLVTLYSSPTPIPFCGISLNNRSVTYRCTSHTTVAVHSRTIRNTLRLMTMLKQPKTALHIIKAAHTVNTSSHDNPTKDFKSKLLRLGG